MQSCNSYNYIFKMKSIVLQKRFNVIRLDFAYYEYYFYNIFVYFSLTVIKFMAKYS